MSAHIGYAEDGSNLIVVWCDTHGGVGEFTDTARATCVLQQHDLCQDAASRVPRPKDTQ